MLKISEEEKKALKGRGIILSNDGEHFVVRVVSSNGVFTAEQLRALSDAAEKYGSGKIAMTVRLTVEIQGVTFTSHSCTVVYRLTAPNGEEAAETPPFYWKLIQGEAEEIAKIAVQKLVEQKII